ncbi:MAG: hypothetical protein AB9835_05020 [Eubacteriales bacterium]
MPILNYTTKVDVYKTLIDIQSQLVKHGAQKILTEYDNAAHLTSLSFVINTHAGQRSVRLPAKTDSVHKVLHRQKVNCDRDHAERVAWRNIKVWVDAQMALLETEQVQFDQLFFPHLINKDGKTLYEAYLDDTFLLSDKM